MLNPEMQTLLDHVKRELENVVFSPPEWVADRLTHKLAGAIVKAIPKGFAESIHEVIEKSVEKSLTDVVSKGVTEGITKAIQPLVAEIALLREALQKNLDDDWWKGDQDNNQTTIPRMARSSELAIALAVDRVPRVCRSAGLLRLPLAIEHGRESGHRREQNVPHGHGESKEQTIISRRRPPQQMRTRIVIDRCQPSSFTFAAPPGTFGIKCSRLAALSWFDSFLSPGKGQPRDARGKPVPGSCLSRRVALGSHPCLGHPAFRSS
jgi:hypothetical protein